MGSLCRSSCRSSLLMGSYFFSLASVIFSPYIRAHIARVNILKSIILLLRDKRVSAHILGMVPITPGTTPKSMLKMSSKAERLPCLRLVAKVATDPTPEQEVTEAPFPWSDPMLLTCQACLLRQKLRSKPKSKEWPKLGSDALTPTKDALKA
jgi:hypothetical protein